MKKKSPRGIPDFSPKPRGFKSGNPADLNQPKAAPPPQPKIKPQQTAQKSGQRGK